MSASNDAVWAELSRQATAAATTSVPSVVAPGLLFEVGVATAKCSVPIGADIVWKSADLALAMQAQPGASKSTTTTIPRTVAWLSKGATVHHRPELLVAARDIAKRVDYKSGGLTREVVYRPILLAMIRGGEPRLVLELVDEIEMAQNAFAFDLAREVIDAEGPDEMKTQLLQRGYLVISEGRLMGERGVRFIRETYRRMPRAVAAEAIERCLSHLRHARDGEDAALIPALEQLLREVNGTAPVAIAEPSRAVPPAETKNEMVRAFEDIQIAARDGSDAVLQRVLQVKDARRQQQLLMSAASALRAKGEVDATQNVTQVLGSMPSAVGLGDHPVESILRAAQTSADVSSDVRRALDQAESRMATAAEAYDAASSDAERLTVYEHLEPELAAVYAYAFPSTPGLAIESALRVVGPQRAEVLTVVLEAYCSRAVTARMPEP